MGVKGPNRNRFERLSAKHSENQQAREAKRHRHKKKAVSKSWVVAKALSKQKS